MQTERIERTPVTVHIPEDALKRAIDKLNEDYRQGRYKPSPEHQRLLDAIERSMCLDPMDYGVIVY